MLKNQLPESYGDEDQNDIMHEIDRGFHDPFEEEILHEELTEEQKEFIAETKKNNAEISKKLEDEELPF